MTEITAAAVKDLREKTGAGMMDCKKALAESKGDIEGAVDWLRKKGLSAAVKKSGRVANQGLVALKGTGKKVAVVEINSETDFVSRNDLFQQFVSSVADVASNSDGDVEKLKTLKHVESGKSVQEALTDLIAKIGENMTLRRSAILEVKEGLVATYMHGAVADGLGKIGVLIGLESKGDVAELEALGKNLAMHVAAAAPICLNITDVPADLLAREKSVLSEQAKASGKPEAVIEKMVEGRLRKFYEEVVLTEQIYVMDQDKKIKDVVAEASKKINAPIELKGFVRFALGEGVEKKEEDFAAEVAAVTGK